MKKLLTVWVASMLLLTTSLSALEIKVDGVKKNVTSKIINDRTMLPLREFSNVLGFKVDYINANNITVTNTITANKIKLAIGRDFYEDNYGNRFTAETPPMLINGVTYVPLRLVAENLDNKVGFDANNTITITSLFNINLENVLKQDGNSITDTMEMDFKLNRDLVKKLEAIYSKYSKLTVTGLQRQALSQDLQLLEKYGTSEQSLSSVLLDTVDSYIKNELAIAKKIESKQNYDMEKMYRDSYINELSERMEYIRTMK